MDTVGHGAVWVLVMSEEAERGEHPAFRSPKATRDTLPGAWHRGGAGDASITSELQLAGKLSGIINQRS